MESLDYLETSPFLLLTRASTQDVVEEFWAKSYVFRKPPWTCVTAEGRSIRFFSRACKVCNDEHCRECRQCLPGATLRWEPLTHCSTDDNPDFFVGCEFMIAWIRANWLPNSVIPRGQSESSHVVPNCLPRTGNACGTTMYRKRAN
jgi:hypothetical protein